MTKLSTRGLWWWLTAGILSALFLVEAANVAIPSIALHFNVVRATFLFDRYLDEGWIRSEAARLANESFAPIMPKFKARPADVDIIRRGLVVSVLVDGAADPYVAGLLTALNRAVTERSNLQAGVRPIVLAELHSEPYQWFKPFDALAMFVLAGAIVAWIVLP